jgi:hypothetical protein
LARKPMADDDAELVALIDNELDESRRTALLARLAADDGLRDAGAPSHGRAHGRTGARSVGNFADLCAMETQDLSRSDRAISHIPPSNRCAGRME